MGQEKTKIWVTMRAEMAEEFKRRAGSMDLTLSVYCKIILLNAIKADPKPKTSAE